MSTHWPIHEVAGFAGISSRTLRYYDAIGLLAPSSVTDAGYRLYDRDALLRLQRILVLRDLGLPLHEIRRVLGEETSELAALRDQIQRLTDERQRISRRIVAVDRTIAALERGEALMPETMFAGWNNDQYKDEVIEKWGASAWDENQRWWGSKTPAEQQAFVGTSLRLIQSWKDAAAAGGDPAGADAQDLARQQVAWLKSVRPAVNESDAAFRGYIRCVANMYVDDSRFAETYGGPDSARFVRDSLLRFLDVETCMG